MTVSTSHRLTSYVDTNTWNMWDTGQLTKSCVNFMALCLNYFNISTEQFSSEACSDWLRTRYWWRDDFNLFCGCGSRPTVKLGIGNWTESDYLLLHSLFQTAGQSLCAVCVNVWLLFLKTGRTQPPPIQSWTDRRKTSCFSSLPAFMQCLAKEILIPVLHLTHSDIHLSIWLSDRRQHYFGISQNAELFLAGFVTGCKPKSVIWYIQIVFKLIFRKSGETKQKPHEMCFCQLDPSHVWRYFETRYQSDFYRCASVGTCT